MSTTAQQKGSLSPESGVSSLVKDAVRQARKSSRIRSANSSPRMQPPTPNGLAIKTSFEHREDTLALALKSPTLSEMDQFLAPTYESGSSGGSNVGISCSFRGSSVGSPRNDIIRKVEIEIATARKAATEAHARLADASRGYGVYDGVGHEDSLDDADFLQDILSVSSVEESTGGDENMPEDDKKAGGSVVKEESYDAVDMARMEPADIASEGSYVSDGIPDVPTQRTFESGVELALENMLPAFDTDDVGVTSNDLAQAENSSDVDSDYTEETVSDDDDDNSEHAEESVCTDDVEATENKSESTEESGHTEDRERSEDLSSPTVERKNEKPWFAGTRGWLRGDEAEPKPATPRGFSLFPQPKAGKAMELDTISIDLKRHASTLIVSNGRGKEVKQQVSVFETGRTETERKTQSAEDTETLHAKSSNLWLLDPEIETNTGGEAGCENAKSFIPPATYVGRETTAINAEVPALTVLTVNSGSKNGASRVQFRYPYPVPPKVPKPRPAPEIILDHSMGTPERVARWSRPKPELEELLLAVKGVSMPRRSNACGALKVLVARQPKNVFSLVRTVGFLEALAFVCSEDVVSSPEMETALIARSRAVTTIMKVSEPRENRVLVMMEPGLPESLVKVIEEDTGEARTHACAALATLAKTPANREPMVKVKELVKVLAQVVNGTIDPTWGPVAQHDPVVCVKSSSFSSAEDSGDDDEGMSTGTSSTASPPISAGNYNPESIRKQKDGKQDEYAMQSKHHACAALMHLSKHCPISHTLCEDLTLMDSMIALSRNFDSPLHTKCIEILCNLTRFPANNAEMTRDDMLVDTLFKCGKSKTVEDRVWALRALQNMASDSASKIILANSKILTLLSICAMRQDEEQAAAVAALYNLSTEPGTVVPITNTRNVVATLVHLAHNALTQPDVRRMSCEALATIGLWLQTLAGSGTVPEGISKVLLPTHKTTGWQRWD